MSTLQERMASAKKHYELIRGRRLKNTEMADYCGVSKVSVGLWFNGPTQELDGTNLTRAAEFLGVNHKWLSGEAAPMVDQGPEDQQGFKNVQFNDNKFTRIPVLDFVQAGSWREVAYDGMEPKGYTHTTYEGKDPSAVFSVTVEGQSMTPEFQPGDEIVIDASISAQPGDYVVAQNGEYEVTFKKYRVVGFNEHGCEVFELVPLNPDFPTYSSNQRPISIIGVVVRHHREFRR